ncbi:MAG: GDSL-type esterase/lipase family protein, partial [Sulfurovum sp.]|nr:GDSL-type esterase/lipase family protein [Sulfurovum sp.]
KISIGGDLVDTSTEGTYTVVYSVSDAAGHKVSIPRDVIVSNTTTPPTTGDELNTWYNTSIVKQRGSLEATFTVVPSATNIDSVIGFSDGEADAYTDLGIIVRFASSGKIDARNGSSYSADNAVNYQANETYTFRLNINFTTKTYSIYVTPEGEDEITIGNNYAFRSEQNNLSTINNVAHFSITNGIVDVGEVSFTRKDSVSEGEKKLIFEVDFSNHTLGYYNAARMREDFGQYNGEKLMGYKEWNGAYVAGGTTNPDNEIVSMDGEKVLKIVHKAGKTGTGNYPNENTYTGFHATLALPKKGRTIDVNNPKPITLDYYVKFHEGFEWKTGGKLPGLAGGLVPAGGQKIGNESMENGFSARFMWHDMTVPALNREGYSIINYIYHPGRKGNIGEYVYGAGAILSPSEPATHFNDKDAKEVYRLESGKWIHIVQEITANKPYQSDGKIRVWIDGNLVEDIRDMKWIQDGKHDTYGVDKLFFANFFGGKGEAYESSRDNYSYFKKIKVYEGSANKSLEPNNKVLVIGDSFTDGADFLQYMTSDRFNFVGTKEDLSIKHEGRSGWTSKAYIGKNLKWYPDSPFVLNNELNLLHYFTNILQEQPNVAVLQLGANDILQATKAYELNPAKPYVSVSNYIDALETLRVALKDTVPNIKIVMLAPTAPGPTLHNDVSQDVHQKIYKEYKAAYLAKFGGRKDEGIYVIDSVFLDNSDYRDAIHPNANGYKKIANELRIMLKKIG